MLKNNPSEDQGSQVNPEDKKHSDRELLLQFQLDENSTSKPAGLPDIPDIILDKPSNGGQKQGCLGGCTQRLTDLSISKDIGLHKAKEAWKPAHGKVKDTPDEAAKTEEVYKKTRSILNKLTPQRFQALVFQMQSLPIDSEAKLKGVVDLVFERAVSVPSYGKVYTNKYGGLSTVFGEPRYSVAYANMCRCLSMFKVPSESKPGEMVNFRAVLLTRCQREFEKDKSSEALFTIKREEIEKAAEDAKKELQAELEYQKMLVKRRSLGNMRFIGELFKLKMITENIMHTCVFKLLCTKTADSETLECLCRLLTTIGKELDSDKAKNRVDQYFQQISKFVNDKKFPLTLSVKFMLQDIMELRLNKWVPRHVVKNPKTIDQIYKEMEHEAQKKALLAQQAKLNKPTRSGRGGSGGNQGQHRKLEGAGDLYSGKQRISLKVDRPDGSCRIKQDSDWKIQLASSHGATRFAGSNVSTQTVEGNTVDGSIQLGSSGASRFKGWWRGSTHSARPAMLLKDEIKKKTTVILDEYLYIQEALLCVKELSSANHPYFVLHSINHVLEKSNVARKQTGHLLHDIVKQKVISVESYIKGLVEVLEFAEDLERDIPMIWKYYGELISPMIQDSSVPMSFLKQVCQPLMASNKAGCLLAEVLKDASHREGHKKVGELWMSSGLEWSDFVPMYQVEQFLVDNKLEFTKGGDSAPTTPTTGLPLSQITEKLEELIAEQHKDNGTVFDWIESNVDEPTTKKPKFIQTLMTAVCKGAIKGVKGKEKVDQKEVADRHDLLQKYLDHQSDSELQALYALQALVTKLEHPQGVLRTMFDTLYDDDIISEDAFIQWEKSEEETEGKGAALKQVKQFFEWLKDDI